jgi:WD40 repeat protein
MSDPSSLEVEIAQARADPRRRFGRFLLLSELGRGGMGLVHRAWDERAGRVVALKTLLPDALRDPEVPARFAREAQALARLRHPGIVPVHESGEHERRPYLVMDLVEGRTFDRALAAGMDLRSRVKVVLDAARALDHAHEQGVIHRDLKPSNVMIGADGRTLVMDFGLAKVVDARTRLSLTGAVLGTPAYLSPEQADGRGAVDARTDVWGLGATLYHALAGKPPFEGASEMNVLLAVATKDPEPPGRTHPEIGALDAICLRCLEKDPARRYPTPAALAGDLERWLANEPIATTRSRAPLVIAAGTLALAAVVAAAGLRRPSPEPPPPPRRDAPPPAEAPPVAVPRPALPAFCLDFLRTPHTERLAVLGGYELSHASEVHGVAVTPDGRVLVSCGSYGRDGTIKTWSLATGEELKCLPLSGTEPTCLALSPDGRRALVGATDKLVRVVDLARCKVVSQLGPCDHKISAVAWSPDGARALVATEKDELGLWDVGLARARYLLGFKNHLAQVGFSTDGTLAIGCEEHGNAWIWELEGNGRRAVAPGRSLTLSAAWLLDDGRRIATVALDGTIALWETGASKPTSTLGQGSGHVRSTALSHDRLIVGDEDGSSRVWSLASGQLVATLPGADGEVRACGFTPDGKRAVTGSDGAIRVWEIDGAREVLARPGHRGAVHGVAFSPDGKTIASVGHDRTWRLWDVAADREARVPSSGGDALECLAFAPDGKRLAVGGRDGSLALVSLEDGSRVPLACGAPVLAAAWDPTGRFVVAGTAKGAVLSFEAATGRPARPLAPHAGEARAVVFTRDGRLVSAGGQDREVRVSRFDGDDEPRTRRIAKIAGEEIRTIAVPPDGKQALVGLLDDKIAVLDLVSADLEVEGTLERPAKSHITSLAASPDGELAASTSDDHAIVLWNLRDRRPIDTIDLSSSADVGLSVAFAPDSGSIVVGTARGVLLRFAVRR